MCIRMNASTSILSNDPFFIWGLNSLLSKELVEDFFIVLDLDSYPFEETIGLLSDNKEIVAFASNDLAFYKADQFDSLTVLDKKGSLRNILEFFLFKRRTVFYKVKRKLTPREKQMLNLIREGLSNEDMAERLGVKHKTLYTYRRNIMLKLGCENRILLQNLILNR